MSAGAGTGLEQSFLVTIRTPDLVEVEAAGAYLSLEVDLLLNDVGSWVLVLPWPHPGAQVLAQPGAGIVVRRVGSADVVASGCWSVWELSEGSDSDSGGALEGARLTVSGPTDDEVLSGDVVFPNPAEDIPVGSAITVKPAAHVVTGPAETALATYVNTHIGPDALERRRVGLSAVPSAGRGQVSQWRERMTVLLDVCQRIAAPSGLAFRVRQGPGASLAMSIRVPVERPEARFSVAAGTLLSARLLRATPDVTEVVVAGGGQATARVFTRVRGTFRDPVRRRQGFLDQRQTDVLAELVQAGTEELARNPQPLAASVRTAEAPWLRWPTHWDLGDLVSVSVVGATVTDVVTRVQFRESTDQPLSVRALIGRGEDNTLTRALSLSRQVQQTIRS